MGRGLCSVWSLPLLPFTHLPQPPKAYKRPTSCPAQSFHSQAPSALRTRSGALDSWTAGQHTHSQSEAVQLLQAWATGSQARSPEQVAQTEASSSQPMQLSGQATHSPSTRPKPSWHQVQVSGSSSQPPQLSTEHACGCGSSGRGRRGGVGGVGGLCVWGGGGRGIQDAQQGWEAGADSKWPAAGCALARATPAGSCCSPRRSR